MRFPIISLICFALLGGTVAFAAQQQTPFELANTAFAQKDYGHAASDYEAIIARQGFSAPVLFDLANAYYLDGKIGLAIVNYERAQLLSPGDADIAFNLRLARAKAGLADRPVPWFERAARFFSPDTLSWIGGAVVLFICAGVVARPFIGRYRFSWRVGMTASVCVLLATLLAVGIRWPELSQAVVTAKNTSVYISPVTVGQPLYNLAEGQTVQVCKAYGDFVLVEMSDGHRGWVKHADLSRLIPLPRETRIAST
jgi:tetratricopeptide (TPR) repeat protein